MSDVVEVALKINIDDSGEPLHQPVHYSVQRLVRCPFGPVRKRTRVKISFKDRLQDELHRSLDHSPLDTPLSVSPIYTHERGDPKTASSSRLSPYGISFASVLAD